jgi:ribosomal protein S18 acetylase RimI-like enzyme
MITIKTFHKDQWEKLKDGIMNIESRCFPKELEMNEEEVSRDCCSNDSVVFIAFDGDSVVGVIYANQLNGKSDDWIDIEFDIQAYKNIDKKVAYICSVGVLPEYRGMGIAKLLKLRMQHELKKQGYEYVLSHSNAGAMTRIDEMLGATIIEENKNWGGSSETHYLTEKKL